MVLGRTIYGFHQITAINPGIKKRSRFMDIWWQKRCRWRTVQASCKTYSEYMHLARSCLHKVRTVAIIKSWHLTWTISQRTIKITRWCSSRIFWEGKTGNRKRHWKNWWKIWFTRNYGTIWCLTRSGLQRNKKRSANYSQGKETRNWKGRWKRS